jgi:RHS repeat-associated protein
MPIPSKHSPCVGIRTCSDYSPFGVELDGRTVSGGYRYGFQNQEKFDDVSGSGFNVDFGERIYNPKIGSFNKIDALNHKYASLSPYSFVSNNPVSHVEIIGDSVLFYSHSGKYLGYSNDNLRYQNKNLVVIINDNDVENFKNQYTRKRSMHYRLKNQLNAEQVEAHIAGLEAMGTTYDVSSITSFIRKYTELVGPSLGESKKSKVKFDANFGRIQAQQEWGAWLIKSKNPFYADKMNWVTLDIQTITTDQSQHVVLGPRPLQGKSWLHLHTSSSQKSTFSGNDREAIRIRNESTYNKGITYWVGKVQFNPRQPGNEINLHYFYTDPSTNVTLSFDKNSFKNAEKK